LLNLKKQLLEKQEVYFGDVVAIQLTSTRVYALPAVIYWDIANTKSPVLARAFY
jgi:hypothetical protein